MRKFTALVPRNHNFFGKLVLPEAAMENSDNRSEQGVENYVAAVHAALEKAGGEFPRQERRSSAWLEAGQKEGELAEARSDAATSPIQPMMQSSVIPSRFAVG